MKYGKPTRACQVILSSSAAWALLMSGGVAHAAEPLDRPLGRSSAPVSVQIVMDASGSMNGKLADGASKLSAARSAIQTLISTLPDNYALSLRAYGHQSSPKAKNCRDSDTLVGLATGARVKEDIIRKIRQVSARGYTPISFSLRKAGEDLASAGNSNRVIILVSDGRERCDGDPCATARKLAAVDPRLTIHTVGFSVGTVARSELRCVARVGKGRYFDARNAAELSQRLEGLPPILARLPAPAALSPPAGTVAPNSTVPNSSSTGGALPRTNSPRTNTLPPASGPTTARPLSASRNARPTLPTSKKARVIVVNRDQPGQLTVDPVGEIHRVIDPDTNDVVGALGATKPTVQLPAGTYNVSFGNGLWRSVDIEPKKLTRLRPAVIEISGAAITGHEVVDTETGEVLAKLTASDPRAVLIPTVVGVKFGPVIWPDIILEEGQTRVLEPGILTVKGGGKDGHLLRTNAETIVTRLTVARPSIPLPPGNYSLKVDGKRVPFSIREGERLVVQVR